MTSEQTIPQNFAETWKFLGSGQIPQLQGSKFHCLRKTLRLVWSMTWRLM